ncbi:unnamed protein product [Cyprideis torosa]|uniref:Uncharacterized protein n=1 Tax=Cyprideis torosa TaxID=163714 RepID=A0A7R8WB92_9CRUS|nr:unnamed protein product [Cyprideis torosa]CAG0890600.1 unnamed protein product [Cyprideis torosa]
MWDIVSLIMASFFRSILAWDYDYPPHRLKLNSRFKAAPRNTFGQVLARKSGQNLARNSRDPPIQKTPRFWSGNRRMRAETSGAEFSWVRNVRSRNVLGPKRWGRIIQGRNGGAELSMIRFKTFVLSSECALRLLLVGLGESRKVFELSQELTYFFVKLTMFHHFRAPGGFLLLIQSCKLHSQSSIEMNIETFSVLSCLQNSIIPVTKINSGSGKRSEPGKRSGKDLFSFSTFWMCSIPKRSMKYFLTSGGPKPAPYQTEFTPKTHVNEVPNCFLVTRLTRLHEWSHANPVAGIDVSSVANELLSYRNVACGACKIKRSASRLILAVHQSSSIKQKLNRRFQSFVAAQVKCSSPHSISSVDVNACLKQDLRAPQLAFDACVVEGNELVLHQLACLFSHVQWSSQIYKTGQCRFVSKHSGHVDRTQANIYGKHRNQTVMAPYITATKLYFEVLDSAIIA